MNLNSLNQTVLTFYKDYQLINKQAQAVYKQQGNLGVEIARLINLLEPLSHDFFLREQAASIQHALDNVVQYSYNQRDSLKNVIKSIKVNQFNTKLYEHLQLSPYVQEEDIQIAMQKEVYQYLGNMQKEVQEILYNLGNYFLNKSKVYEKCGNELLRAGNTMSEVTVKQHLLNLWPSCKIFDVSETQLKNYRRVQSPQCCRCCSAPNFQDDNSFSINYLNQLSDKEYKPMIIDQRPDEYQLDDNQKAFRNQFNNRNVKEKQQQTKPQIIEPINNEYSQLGSTIELLDQNFLQDELKNIRHIMKNLDKQIIQ